MFSKLKRLFYKLPILSTLIFIGFYILLFEVKNTLFLYFSDDGTIKVSSKYLINGVFNFAFGFASLCLIKKVKIKKLAGISNEKGKNLEIALFPIYIIIISLVVDIDGFNFDEISLINWFTLFFWTISIGFSEEIMFRGFLQSIIIRRFAKNKISLILSVLLAATLFGVLHLVDYSHGFYGESSQVLYSIFFGIYFGATLLVIKKIWPIILSHVLIDFFGVIHIFERTEIELNINYKGYYDFNDFLYLILLVSPCLIYGFNLLFKMDYSDIKKSIESN